MNAFEKQLRNATNCFVELSTLRVKFSADATYTLLARRDRKTKEILGYKIEYRNLECIGVLGRGGMIEFNHPVTEKEVLQDAMVRIACVENSRSHSKLCTGVHLEATIKS
jgi:hypothetical protein